MTFSLANTWVGRQRWLYPQSRLARWSLWLVVGILLLAALRLLPGDHPVFLGFLIIGLLVVMPLSLVLLIRALTRRFLWKVRNRLILSYMLMGLAPIVLLGTLASVAAYIDIGQFAINNALFSLDEVSDDIRTEVTDVASLVLAQPGLPKHPLTLNEAGQIEQSGIAIAMLQKGKWTDLPLVTEHGPVAASPFAGQSLPSWLKPGFHGVVALDGHLYVCRDTRVTTGQRTEQLLGSVLVGPDSLNVMAGSLGRILVFPGFTLAAKGADEKKLDNLGDNSDKDQDVSFVSGGTLPPPAHFFDLRVYFTAPLNAVSWRTGNPIPAMMAVISRPSVLYTRLFSTSMGAGRYLRTFLIAMGVVFGLLELIALWMAVRLSRTITRSVAGLYRGTTEIDKGNLAYRVRAERKDQFGALATSFNSMASSIEVLLVQQREKERLLSELAIAQEVQTNLFPRSPALAPGLELHGKCVPARVVSGDYFDFIFEVEGGLCLALGDISGKGISAALLMASLSSAVRAFSLSAAAEDASPARLLAQLNTHLHRSTQPEKYATLFLAYYQSATGKLTYTNGGHLSPFILSPDGGVQRLDVGGSVVGLLPGLAYEEATVHLQRGDLLVAYTDGLTEPERGTEEFGETRLLTWLRAHWDQDLPSLADGTFSTVQSWIGDAEQPDDMTLVFARQL